MVTTIKRGSVSDTENNDEIWSTVNTSQAQHNSTNQTSMYEDENDHEKITPFYPKQISA